MRAYGVCWAFLFACVLASACGSDKPPAPKDQGTGGDDAAAGGGGKNGSGTTSTGGTASDAGKTNGLAGEHTNGGAPDPGVAGMNGDGGQPQPPGPRSITFDVNGDEDVHPISPLIYGANMDGLDCADSKARFTFCHRRSASWSTYNWENNASNAGQIDCNENNDALSASSVPGAAITDLIEADDAIGAATIVTVPMLDHAALDKNGGSAADACSGDVSKTNDYLNTRFVQNRPRKGSALSLTPDTADGYVNQDEFVAFLKDGYTESDLLFSLDYQPELWKSDHPKVRLTPLTYDEQIALSVDYAKMIKDTWSGAQVLGLVGYGYLAALSQQDSPDYTDDGEFFSFFLKQMSEASAADARRLVDYVDLHWFPEIYPNGQRIIGEDATAASVTARVQAPRQLWDPDFIEDSWITGVNGGQPVELLTWIKERIDLHYPGTKIALSEWTYGGGKDVSGAIAAADALGIFGQRSLDLAGVVSFSQDDEPYLIGAFQAYRNYDGQGHGFGDTSVFASSSNTSLGSIYASVDDADPSRMVLVAINRYDYELDATLNIAHTASYTSLTPYTISDGHPEPVAGDVITTDTPNSFQMTLPPYSVWVLVPSE
jgi:hypothetical protein